MTDDLLDYPLFFDFNKEEGSYSVISCVDVERSDVLVTKMVNFDPEKIEMIDAAAKSKQIIKFESRNRSVILVDIAGFSKCYQEGNLNSTKER